MCQGGHRRRDRAGALPRADGARHGALCSRCGTTLSNDLGGTDVAYVLVQVTPDAPLLPPSANDLALTLKEIAGKTSVTVDIFDGSAFNLLWA